MRFSVIVSVLSAGMLMNVNSLGQDPVSHPFAPAFALKGTNDRVISLADYKGKVVAVTFWKSSCLLCDKETSNLVTLLDKYASQGMAVIGISTDDPPHNDQTKTGYSFVHGDKRTVDQYGSPIAPATFLVGRDGRIYSKHSDYVPSATLDAEIRQLLAAKGAAELVAFKPSGKAEEIRLPSEKELNSEIPGVDLSKLNQSQARALAVALDATQCPCGCGNTMLGCRRRHGECAMSRDAAQREWKKLLDESK